MKHRIAILLAFLMMASFTQCFAQILANRGIEIRIQGVPPEEKGRIDGGYSVSSSGTVRMPLIGEVSVAGMSTNAAAAKLRQLLPAMQAHLRSKGWEVNVIRLKIQTGTS